MTTATYPHFSFSTDSRDRDVLHVSLLNGVPLGFVWSALSDEGPRWRGRAGSLGVDRSYTSFGRTREACAQMMLDGLSTCECSHVATAHEYFDEEYDRVCSGSCSRCGCTEYTRDERRPLRGFSA